MSRSVISGERYAERLARTQALLPAHDAAALLIGVGADLVWLTGYAAMPLERLTMLVLAPEGRPTLVVPRLELAAAQTAPAVRGGLLEVATWRETESPFELVADLLAASKSRPEIQLGPLGGAWGRLGALLVSDSLRAAFLLNLQAAVPDAAFGIASPVLGPLRAIKDAEEVALLRQAAEAADRVVEQICSGRLVGRTEVDVAREVSERLVGEGHDSAAFAIVASGPSSASPHHEASDRIIAAGEPIVLDIGGRLGGYYSDITRTLWVTGDEGVGPTEDFARLYEVLESAQAAGRERVAVGVAAQEVDAAARAVIDEAGLGEHFIHRTGHGIGLEGHEDPYIVAGNDEPLAAGHAFSVEPGIYLDGRHGARLEDIVVCSAAGADSLNRASRALRVIRGT
ncbi:MAG TPA: Xaa-Pro peptidase family protein [Candidatus Limnocylindrales bacterium]|nr:Xaa-Pro peptidase family protein [Candidatus Limnocylindrales bacterium]